MVNFFKKLSSVSKVAVELFALIVVLGIVFSIIYGGSLDRAKVVVNGNAVAVEVADTPEARSRGLSFRRYMNPNEGMLFIFEEAGNYGFWMKDMNFPIDIVWIRDNKVLGVKEGAIPEPDKNIYELPIHYPPGEIDRVLEVGAGRAAALGLTPGSSIKIQGL